MSSIHVLSYLVLLLGTTSSITARTLLQSANTGAATGSATCDASKFQSRTLSTDWTSSAVLPIGWVEAWTVLALHRRRRTYPAYLPNQSIISGWHAQ